MVICDLYVYVLSILARVYLIPVSRTNNKDLFSFVCKGKPTKVCIGLEFYS